MKRPLHVGQIPFLNCILFFHALERNPAVRLSPLVPRALSGAAANGAVDAGPVPLVDTWELEDDFEPLEDFCISTTARARSVLFFSNVPFESLDGRVVGLTEQSSTSVRLLRVLLPQVWGATPARFDKIDPGANDAFLVIGDDALRHRGGVASHPYMADLGEAWKQWTGLPFVFARWVVRKDVPPADRRRLVELLDESIAAGWRDLERIAAGYAAALDMTVAEIREYLEGFRFRATDEEREAMARFRELAAPLAGKTST